MEENRNPIPEPIPQPPAAPPEPDYTAGNGEFLFGGILLVLSVLLCNFVLYGGFNLGFALAEMGCILCAALYLKRRGRTFGWYEKSLLGLSLVIAAGFGRSADGFVKFVMVHFLFLAVNLALCLGAGQNRRDPQGAASLLDAPRAFFILGLGRTGRAGKGLRDGIRRGGAAVRRLGAVGTGLLISLPVVAVMILLLINADAAFEGLMDLLPEIELEEYLISGFWGVLLGWLLYSRGIGLDRNPAPAPAWKKPGRVNTLTVNTVLCMVCLVYGVYLVSQLAYLSGGLAGILPEDYTLAEYARRGFFEMAWLCVLNLGILCGSLWLTGGQLSRVTKIAGTFLGTVTIFLVVTASAKMFLYIGSYGLTRLRVLTEVIMLWLALTTVLITIRLYAPKFGYMKAVVLTAMVLGALVFWADVDTVVADYNVTAYQSGRLENIDMNHLRDLGPEAAPWLEELTEDDDPEVASQAKKTLRRLADQFYVPDRDWRSWNWAFENAWEILEDYREGQ